MPAYLVATVAVHDPETYRKYTARVPALLARHGGKFLTRGNPVTTLEGTPFTERMVILEFPTQARCEAFFTDPEYVEAAALRRAASTARIVVQDGAADPVNPAANV